MIKRVLILLYDLVIMIANIIGAWKDYASYMGSRVYNENNCFFAVNKNSQISCDFSNCIVCAERSNLDNEDIFKIKPVQTYTIFPGKELLMQNVNGGKIASLMVLRNCKFIKLAEAKSSPELRIRELEFNELSKFAEIVFDAFAYDKENIAQSIEFYKRGFESGMVRYYGLNKNSTLVSVVLIHQSSNKLLYGLELVATSKQYQGNGYSKFLLTQVLEQLFLSRPDGVWLFAIEGSVAETLYKKLGFSIVGKILISKVQ
ncbi:MAG: GNAT family N-acetyltransferase [Thermodesulfobium sp.]